MTHALGSLVTIAGVTVALPWALVRVAGSPLPTHLPDWDELVMVLSRPDDGTLLLAALKYLTWIAWSVFVLLLITEAIARLGRKPTPHIPGLRGPQQLAALLLTGIGAFIVGTTTSYGRPTALPPVASPAAIDTGPSNLAHGRGDHLATQASTMRQQPTIVTVKPGESLWTIARHQLPSNASDARTADLVNAIYRKNAGCRQPDGARLSDRNRIYVGWKLRIPSIRTHGEPHHPKPQEKPEPPSPSPTRSPSPRPSTDRTPSPSHHAAPSQQAPDQGIRLPSGAVAGLSLAAGIGAAVVLARRQRTRRRGVAVPGTATEEPLAPVQRRLRHARLAFRDNSDDASDRPELVEQPSRGRRRGRHARSAGGRRLSPRHRDSADAPARARHRESPDSVLPLGVRDTEGGTGWDLTGVAGLGLDGPAATDVTRHLITYLLAPRPDADGMPRVDADRVEILLADAGAAALLPPTAGLPPVPGLIWTANLDDALARAEAEVVHRTRLLTDADTSDYHLYRASDPSEPLPLMVLIAAPPDGAAADRLATVLSLGRNLGIAGILLGTWPHGATCSLDAAGRCTAVTDPALAGLRGAQLATLREPDARELIHLIAAAHGHHHPQPSLADTAAHPAAYAGAPAASPTHVTQPQPSLPTTVPTPRESVIASAPGPPSGAETPPPTSTPDAGTPATRAPEDGAAPRGERGDKPVNTRTDVWLHVLGPVHLTAGEHPAETGPRRKSKELLVWLALHHDGGSWETIAADLWPDADRDHARERVHDALTSLRRALRTQLGPGRYITHANGRYRLEAAAITDVDLWAFTRHLHTAAHTTDPTTRVQHLRAAAELDAGPLGADIDTEWIEPAREAHRRNAADTHAHLAELVRPHNREAALDHLLHAADIDPYNEELARRVMRAQADLGRHDAVRRTYQLLESRLAELDAEPEPETHALMTELRTHRAEGANTPSRGRRDGIPAR